MGSFDSEITTGSTVITGPGSTVIALPGATVIAGPGSTVVFKEIGRNHGKALEAVEAEVVRLTEALREIAGWQPEDGDVGDNHSDPYRYRAVRRRDVARAALAVSPSSVVTLR